MSFLHLRIDRRHLGSLSQAEFAVRQEEEYYVVGGPKLPVWLRLRIRLEYPQTYCCKIDSTTIVCGYGPLRPGVCDEYLQIFLTRDGTATVHRDAYATLPLWFGDSQDVASLSNEHHTVYGDLPRAHLDRQLVLNALMPNPAQASTIWREMQPLNERHTLEIGREHFVVCSPSPRKWQLSAEAPASNFRDFSRRFSAQLDHFTDSRLAGQRFAFEVSGGLDSSTLALYYARLGNTSGMGMASLIFPGDFETTQRAKLDAIAHLSGLPRYEVSLNTVDNYPLANLFQDDAPRPFYCLENIYAAPIKQLLAQLANRGVCVIATGHGGDDLFENTISLEETLRYGAAERERRRHLRYAPFFTEKFRKEHLDEVADRQPYPVPLLSASLLNGFIALNNTYIEQDIWPVSPFIDPDFHEFCQGLPTHWRSRKAIMRVFYDVYGFPEEIFNPVQNEHFGTFFEAAMTSGQYDNLIGKLAEHSVAAEMGYVDPNLLVQTYNESKQPYSPKSEGHLMALYAWLCFEINAQGVR